MKTVRMGESAREGGRRMSVSGDVSAPVDSTSRRQMLRWPLRAWCVKGFAAASADAGQSDGVRGSHNMSTEFQHHSKRNYSVSLAFTSAPLCGSITRMPVQPSIPDSGSSAEGRQGWQVGVLCLMI